MKKQKIFLFLFIVFLCCCNLKNERNQIEQDNSERIKNVFSDELLKMLQNTNDKSWPLYLVVFSKENEDNVIYVIGSLLYSEKLIGYHKLNDIIYAFYIDGCVPFANELVDFNLLVLDNLGSCNYENRLDCPIPAFEEEYSKFLYIQGELEFVEQGRLELIKAESEFPSIIRIIKERLEIPPTPK